MGCLHRIASFLRLPAIVGPLPFTLTNGTVADANQVQGDLQYIADQVNLNAAPSGGASGAQGTNILYNGAMRIAQRIGLIGGSVNISAGSAYGLDRWEVLNSGASSSVDVTDVTSTGLTGFTNAMRVQRTAGNAVTTAIQVFQSLETIDSVPLQGQVCTLSFRARNGANFSPANSTVNATVWYGTGTDENFQSYTGATVAFTLAATLSSSWQTFQVTGTIPVNANEVAVVFSWTPSGTAGAADYADFTGVQLEIAPGATAFQLIPFGTDLARCQRYYQKSFEPGVKPSNATGNGMYFLTAIKAGASFHWWTFALPVALRNAFTGTVYNPQAANAQIRDVTASADFSGSLVQAQFNTLVISGTGNASTAVGNELWVQWTMDGEL